MKLQVLSLIAVTALTILAVNYYSSENTSDPSAPPVWPEAFEESFD